MERNEIVVIGCALCGKSKLFNNAPKAQIELANHMAREHNKTSPYTQDAMCTVMIGYERAVSGLIQPANNTDPLAQFLDTRTWMREQGLLQ